MTRLNKILVGLLVVQVVLAIVMFSRDRGGGIAQLEPLTAGLDAAKVSRVQVFAKREKGATGDAKAAVDLVKKGDAWVLASAFDYPADASKVTQLLGNVSGLQSRGPIATSSARYAQLGVADDVYERKVVITTAAGEHVLFVGGSAGAQRTAVRKTGDSRVHGVPSNKLSAWSIEPEARGWVDRTYAEIAKDDIAAITVKTAKGTIELDRSTGSWKVAQNGAPVALAAGESIDGAAADAIAGKLAKIELAAPADPARDAASPTATITVRMKAPPPDADAGAVSASAPERVVDVIADGDRYWVRERGNARAILVDKWALDSVVDAGPATLVKKATPPAAGAKAGSAAMPPGAPPPRPPPGAPPMPPG